MKFIYSDGGRSNYFKGSAGDCVVRAVCNATGKDYKEVYNAINELAKSERTGKRKKGVSSARNGVYKPTIKKYIEKVLGWVWCPTMAIGQGCKVHLDADELPSGVLIVNVSGHLTCVKDGVLYDTYDCTREGNRCVYGYWKAPTADEKHNALVKTQLELRLKELKARQTAELKELEARQTAELKKLEAYHKREVEALKDVYELMLKKC